MDHLQKSISVREFVLHENHTLDIMKPVTDKHILSLILNPFTKQPYDGMLVSGVVAEFDILNNNNRYYNEENYIPFIKSLRNQIQLKGGVLSELEHPQGFATSALRVSHKIVDIWYVPSEKKVYATFLLLNTPNGLIAQEIFKSGYCLGASARAGGKEHKNPDGTFTSEINLLVGFDLVVHSGFNSAIIDKAILIDGFANLNESTNFNESTGLFSFKTFKDGSIEDNLITSLNESANIEPPKNKKLSKQDKVQEKQDADILEEGKPSNKNSIENELENAVDTELKQQQQESMINSMNQSTSLLKKKLGGNYYDDSSAFKTTGLDLPILNNQVSTESPSV